MRKEIKQVSRNQESLVEKMMKWRRGKGKEKKKEHKETDVESQSPKFSFGK